MLDNASGSAAILDIAQKLRNVTPLNKLRFIWFGGEDWACWAPPTTSTT
jgi:Zn-dependent M28 family amino/carboxypeptidase